MKISSSNVNHRLCFTHEFKPLSKPIGNSRENRLLINPNCLQGFRTTKCRALLCSFVLFCSFPSFDVISFYALLLSLLTFFVYVLFSAGLHIYGVSLSFGKKHVLLLIIIVIFNYNNNNVDIIINSF